MVPNSSDVKGYGPKSRMRHNIALKYKIEARYSSSNISVGQMAPAAGPPIDKISFKFIILFIVVHN